MKNKKIVLEKKDIKVAERILKENDKKCRRILDYSPFIVVLHCEGRIVFANKAALKLFGADNFKKVSNRPIIDFLHPDYRDAAKKRVEIVIKKRKKNSPREEKILLPDGRTVDLEVFSFPFDYQGKPAALVFAEDITERKKILDNLIKSETNLKTIFNHVSDEIMYVDRTGTIIDVNKRVEDIFGEKREELIGKKIFQPGLFKVRNLKQYIRLFADLLRGKKVPDYFEVDVESKAGQKFFIEVRPRVIRTAGKISGFLVVIRDITEKKKKDELLRASEQKFRNIFENVNDEIVYIDKTGRIIDVNKRVEDIFGYKPEEAIGKQFFELNFFDKKNLPEMLNLFRKIISRKKAIGFYTMEAQTRKGENIIIEVSSRLVKENGQAEGLILIIRDVTWRKKEEEATKRSEEMFRSIFNSANDYLVYIDNFGRIIDVNDKAVEGYGGKRNELIGKYFTETGLIASPKDLPRLTNYLKEAFSGKAPSLNVRVKNKFGREVDLECSTSLLRIGERVTGVLVVARDITERKDAERRLREEKDKIQKYFDVAGIIILVRSPDGKILFVNKNGAEMIGYSAGEMIGKDWIKNFVARDGVSRAEEVFKCLIFGRPRLKDHIEIPVRTRSNEKKIITWHNTVLNDEKGNIQAILSAGVDITDLRKAQLTIGELKEVDRMKDEFLNIATHELKTPLTSIVGLSEVIGSQKSTLTKEHQKYIGIIHDEGMKLSHIIKRILMVTRYESGREILFEEKINLGKLIDSILPSLEILVNRKHAKISVEIKDKNMEFVSDKEKISEVIYNFIDNAVKYGPEGQTITISASRIDKNYVKIGISDQGKGIPKEQQIKLFAKFSQLEPSLSRSEEGTGLGLYICKLIANKLGGEVGVESVIGKGSMFYFTVPLKRNHKNNKKKTLATW